MHVYEFQRYAIVKMKSKKKQKNNNKKKHPAALTMNENEQTSGTKQNDVVIIL